MNVSTSAPSCLPLTAKSAQDRTWEPCGNSWFALPTSWVLVLLNMQPSTTGTESNFLWFALLLILPKGRTCQHRPHVPSVGRPRRQTGHVSRARSGGPHNRGPSDRPFTLGVSSSRGEGAANAFPLALRGVPTRISGWEGRCGGKEGAGGQSRKQTSLSWDHTDSPTSPKPRRNYFLSSSLELTQAPAQDPGHGQEGGGERDGARAGGAIQIVGWFSSELEV